MHYRPPVGSADVATKRDLDDLAEILGAKLDSFESGLRAEFNDGLRTNLLGMVAANAAMAGIIVAALKIG